MWSIRCRNSIRSPFSPPVFMILSTVVPVNDLLSEPPTRKGFIVVGHAAGAPATPGKRENSESHAQGAEKHQRKTPPYHQQSGGGARMCRRKREKMNQLHNPSEEGARRNWIAEEDKTTSHTVLCHIRSNQITQIARDSERGGSAGPKKKMTRKPTVLCRNEWPDYPDQPRR